MNLTQSEYVLYGTSGACALIAVVLSVHLMLSHLYHWKDAQAQLSIVRIVMMVPVYALTGWATVLFSDYALYLDLVRVSYDSVVLYEFFRLLIHYFTIEAPHDPLLSRVEPSTSTFYLNDDDDEEQTTSPFMQYLKGFEQTRWPFPLCCLPPFVPGVRFFLIVKSCILQYVFLRPVLSFLAVLLSLRGQYRLDTFSVSDGHLWITLLCNVSIAIALFVLYVFYQLLAGVIARHRPIWKFLSIKLLVFFVFWQSLVIAVFYYFDVLPVLAEGWSVTRSAVTVENMLLICVEMPIVSLSHLWIYSVDPYRPLPPDETSLAPELLDEL